MKNFLLFVMILHCSVIAFAQSQDITPTHHFTPTSPEAASLSKMVNYPISYNTGLPSIHVPLYEISAGGFSLPIRFNYNAAGFKINEKSGRYGLGWSLSTDIQITRTINGKCDFDPQGGYIRNNLMRSHKSNGANQYPFSSTNTQFFYENAYNIASGYTDGMPDQFYYKLFDKSGSFYFMKNSDGTSHKIVTVPMADISISYSRDHGTFTIIDTDGTEYRFGEPGPIYSDNLHQIKKELTYGDVTAWKCARVISNKGETMTFNYQRKTDRSYTNFSQKVEYFNNPDPCGILRGNYFGSNEYPLNSYSDYSGIIANNHHFYEIASPKYKVYRRRSVKLHVPYVDTDQELKERVFADDYLEFHSSGASGALIEGIALSSISFRGGEVLFNGADRLTSIKIVDDNNGEVKRFEFHSSEKGSLQYSHIEPTVYLDSISIKNATESFGQYKFGYESKYNFGSHLTGYDLWGFKNFTTQNISPNSSSETALLVPKTVITQDIHIPQRVRNGYCGTVTEDQEISIGGGDRYMQTPDPTENTEGMLQTIVYPTGGFVDFDFETNQYFAEFRGTSGNYTQNMVQYGGGLRIRSINYYTEDGQLAKQKYYRYGENEEGTGELLINPAINNEQYHHNYRVENYSQNIKYIEGQYGDWPEYDDLSTITTENKTVYRPASVLNYSYPGGALIHYNKVTEYQRNLGKSTGKTVYEFYPHDFFEDYPSNAPNNHLFLVRDTNIPYLRTNWMRGKMKSKSNYSYDAQNGFSLKNKTEYQYTPYELPNRIKVANAFLKTIYKFVGGRFDSYGGDAQYSYYRKFDDRYDYIVNEYGLRVGVLLLSEKIETTVEKGVTAQATTDYFYDDLPYLQPSKIITTDANGERVRTTNKYCYHFNDDVSTEMKSKNMLSQVVESTITNLSKNIELSKTKINYTKPYGRNFIAPKSVQTSVKGEALETKSTYLYNQYGNIIETIDQQGRSTSFLWGYHFNYPVAKLVGVRYDDIPSRFKNNSSISNPSNDTQIEAVLEDLRNTYVNYSKVSSNFFTYKPLIGVRKIIDQNGTYQQHNYDAIGRLSSVVDHDGETLKSYEYHLSDNIDMPTYLHPNVPVQRTIGFDCNTKQFIHHTIEGGTDPHYTHDRANDSAESDLNDYADDYAENNSSFVECPSIADEVATLEFQTEFYAASDYPSGYYKHKQYPRNIWVDIIKDNSIVATQKIHSNSIYADHHQYTQLLLPEGAYKLSFRMDADVRFFESYIPDYSYIVNGEENTVEYLRNGDSVFFDADNDYTIRIYNWRVDD